MNPYSHAEWRRFRNEVIKLDGGKCVQCQRGPADGVVLQVHHKAYVSGRLPWEYGHTECETLCKGCHAAEHGIIMPQTGWTLLATDDLGGLYGSCELCGTELRYVYAIEHPNWGAMAVGTDCCDNLTGTTEASEYHARMIKQRDKRKRFVGSKKWQKFASGSIAIVRAGIQVCISRRGDKFRLSMDDAQGKVDYDTELDAKIKAFDLIESGNAADFLSSRRAKLRERRRQELSRKAQTPPPSALRDQRQPSGRTG